jgi:hypothetical protein
VSEKPAPEAGMFVQMRSPFSGKWLKIDIEDGAIAEFRDAAWPDIPYVSSTIALPQMPSPPLHPPWTVVVVNEAIP